MKSIPEAIGWMFIVLIVFTVIGFGIWLVEQEGYQAGLQKGLSVGVENCDPYLPADPRMR